MVHGGLWMAWWLSRLAWRILELSILRLRMGIGFWLWVAILGLDTCIAPTVLELRSLPLLRPVLLSSGIHMSSQRNDDPPAQESFPKSGSTSKAF
jgi:hypothetical protein